MTLATTVADHMPTTVLPGIVRTINHCIISHSAAPTSPINFQDLLMRPACARSEKTKTKTSTAVHSRRHVKHRMLVANWDDAAAVNANVQCMLGSMESDINGKWR